MGLCGTSDESVTSDEMIEQMHNTSTYDVVIVCTSSLALEEYWQARLEAGRGNVCGKDTSVLVVHEDWAGGAGNGLGSLYAFQKACAKAKALDGSDLESMLGEGKSVVLYHTAGKGTRLAPLPATEANNKPGVKLPSVLTIPKAGGAADETEVVLLTILEAVIIQTSLYADSHKGRLAVYWGDQVFVPTVDPCYKPTHHADILAQLGPMPSAEDWEKKELHKYGLVAVDPETGHATQLEKVSYETAASVLNASTIAKGMIGTSLGSFSISAALLKGLLGVFSEELSKKEGKLDTDPHWWMPMCLDLETYKTVMGTKGMSAEEAQAHFERMGAFKSSFLEANTHHTGMLGAVGIGQSCYWWDYGQLKLYTKNVLLAKETTEEAHMYRKFLKIQGVASGVSKDSAVGETTISDSTVVNSTIKAGTVTSSVVAKCCIGEINVTNSVLVNVTARKVQGDGLVLYNVSDDSEEGLVLEANSVRGDCYLPGDKLVLSSATTVDGGKAWKEKNSANNNMSFEDIYEANQSADVIDVNKRSEAEHARVQGVIEPVDAAPAEAEQ